MAGHRQRQGARTGGRPRHKLEAHAELVDGLLAAKRDATLAELRRGLLEEGVMVSLSAVDRYLKARGLTLKKRQAMPPSRSGLMLPPPGSPGVSGKPS